MAAIPDSQGMARRWTPVQTDDSHGLTPTDTCCRRIRGSTPLRDVSRRLPPGFRPGHYSKQKSPFPLQHCVLGESCECSG